VGDAALSKKLIKNGTVITVDPSLGVLEGADIIVGDDKLLDVGRDLESVDAEVVDAAGMIIIPGLINAHIHTWQTGLRGIAGNWTSVDYQKNIHRGLAMVYTAEATYLGNLVGALGQISSGTTTIMDWCHVNATPEHSDGAIDGLEESGIRALFAHGTVKPEKKEGEKHFSEIPHPRSEIERLRKGRLSNDEALVTLGMAILGPENSTKDVMLHDFALAREFGLVSSSHTWNRSNRVVKEGFYPIAEAGLLGPDHNIVHGNYLVDDELKMLIDHGVSVTATPTIEAQSAKAAPLCGRVKRLGDKVSLGSDSEVFVAGDMFHVMRFALQFQHAIDCREEANDQMPMEKLATTPYEALEWATIAGARALQMEDKIGSITPGKKADLVFLKMDDLCLQPIHDPVNTVVLFADRSSVSAVMIDGRFTKKAGKMTKPADQIARRQSELGAAVQKVFEFAGYDPLAG
jgi:cytosine/adenosine deaminase-related metal-dependent hydrolase